MSIYFPLRLKSIKYKKGKELLKVKFNLYFCEK